MLMKLTPVGAESYEKVYRQKKYCFPSFESFCGKSGKMISIHKWEERDLQNIVPLKKKSSSNFLLGIYITDKRFNEVSVPLENR
jgi:hypothetical protein